MGQARELMDRVTRSIFETKDLKAAEECYARDAVAIAPDAGELRGAEQIADYLQQLVDGFPDGRYEPQYTHESGNTAIDEGIFVGTNTAPLRLPSGEVLPATNKRVRVRGCDVVTVSDGLIVEHRFYFDQVDFLQQLGLMPDTG